MNIGDTYENKNNIEMNIGDIFFVFKEHYSLKRNQYSTEKESYKYYFTPDHRYEVKDMSTDKSVFTMINTTINDGILHNIGINKIKNYFIPISIWRQIKLNELGL